MRPNQHLRAWLSRITASQRKLVTNYFGLRTSSYLIQLAADPSTTGARNATAETAAKLERAVIRAREIDRAIPMIHRHQVCSTCAACPHVRSQAFSAAAEEGQRDAAPNFSDEL